MYDYEYHLIDEPLILEGQKASINRLRQKNHRRKEYDNKTILAVGRRNFDNQVTLGVIWDEEAQLPLLARRSGDDWYAEQGDLVPDVLPIGSDEDVAKQLYDALTQQIMMLQSYKEAIGSMRLGDQPPTMYLDDDSVRERGEDEAISFLKMSENMRTVSAKHRGMMRYAFGKRMTDLYPEWEDILRGESEPVSL